MGYTVEFSFDLRLHHDSENTRRDIILRAEKHNCVDCYWMYEIEGAKHIERNHCVITATFDCDNMTGFIKYLRFIRGSRNFFIESIYHDESTLLFASKCYLSKMDRDKAREFKTSFRNKKCNDLWTDNERNIIRTMKII